MQLSNELNMTTRACEQSVSEAENRVERANNRVERSMEQTWKNDGAKAVQKWEVTEQEQSGERGESATHSPLQPNVSLTS